MPLFTYAEKAIGGNWFLRVVQPHPPEGLRFPALGYGQHSVMAQSAVQFLNWVRDGAGEAGLRDFFGLNERGGFTLDEQVVFCALATELLGLHAERDSGQAMIPRILFWSAGPSNYRSEAAALAKRLGDWVENGAWERWPGGVQLSREELDARQRWLREREAREREEQARANEVRARLGIT